MKNNTSNFANNNPDLPARIRRYLDKVPPAVSGSRGHDQTFSVACILVNGFALSVTEAEPFMREYSARCSPPWSDKEIAHKLKSAEQANHDKPRGHLLGGNGTAKPNPAHEKKQPKAKLATPPVSVKGKPLPAPIADGARILLQTAFEPGDYVRIVVGEYGEDGKDHPATAGVALKASEWLKRLEDKEGDPNRIFSTTAKLQPGLFVGMNPVQPEGKSDNSVTNFRHALVEFDDIPKEQQFEAITASGLPCTVIIDSGGRSLHAWVRVDAKDREEYDKRVALIYARLEGFRIDAKNKNPSRLSRLPGCARGDKRQELLIANKDVETFTAEDGDFVTDGLPSIIDAADLVADESPTPPELIAGILHQGSKMVIGGGSKSYKTWALADLALSVGYGVPWLGRKTIRGRVLFLNFEIQSVFMRDRLKQIAKARGVKLKPGVVDFWNLRGYSADHSVIIPKILKRIVGREYCLIILDPLYKLMGGADENSARDIALLLNQIERLAVESEAAVAFGSHFSKGSQNKKEAMDRISGSGVFARDPDTILTITAHEQEKAFTVEATLRNFPPVDSFVIQWAHPLFNVSDLDPSKLKAATPNRTYTHPQILECLEPGMTTTEWKNAAMEETGMSKATFFKLIPGIPKTKAWKVGKTWQKLEIRLAKSNQSNQSI